MAPCPGGPSGRLSAHTNDSLPTRHSAGRNFSRDLRDLLVRRAPVIVVQADNVIFAEVVTVLDLDDVTTPSPPTTNQCSERRECRW
jgi:hypothetical protein